MKNALIVFTKGFVLGLVAFNMGFAIWGCGEESSPPGVGGNGGSEQSNQPCQTDENCNTGDPCRIGTCNAASATCLFTPFDGDEDGHAPRVCGGDDCDDTTGAMHPGLEERCDERDNDCDGQVDDGLDCENSNEGCGPEHRNCTVTDQVCVDGQCVCENDGRRCTDEFGGINSCGVRCTNETEGTNDCVNLTSHEKHCGACNHLCDEDQSCVHGECRARDVPGEGQGG